MYYVGVHRGLNFLSVDPLPYVQVPPGEAKVVLERLEVSALISGMFAETTQTLTFRNPNRRALEGTLLFPLPEGAVVCGYAIDLDGELVDGVIVPKQEARRILEAEIRKEDWAPLAFVSIIVSDGMVELTGAVGSAAQRDGLVVLAQRAEGVRSVKDHLIVRPASTSWGALAV